MPSAAPTLLDELDQLERDFARAAPAEIEHPLGYGDGGGYKHRLPVLRRTVKKYRYFA